MYCSESGINDFAGFRVKEWWVLSIVLFNDFFYGYLSFAESHLSLFGDSAFLCGHPILRSILILGSVCAADISQNIFAGFFGAGKTSMTAADGFVTLPGNLNVGLKSIFCSKVRATYNEGILSFIHGLNLRGEGDYCRLSVVVRACVVNCTLPPESIRMSDMGMSFSLWRNSSLLYMWSMVWLLLGVITLSVTLN